MTYEEMKQKHIDKLVTLEFGSKEYESAAKALAELMKSEAEIKKAEMEGMRAAAEEKRAEAEGKKAEAEFKRIEAEAWKCESEEAIAKTEAMTSIAHTAIDCGTKVFCAITAAKITKLGYELITEHEELGVCTSAVKGFIPKLKFW